MSYMNELQIHHMNDDVERDVELGHRTEREVSRALREQEEQELSRLLDQDDETDYDSYLGFVNRNRREL